jgi:hypothetical protein
VKAESKATLESTACRALSPAPYRRGRAEFRTVKPGLDLGRFFPVL